MQQYIRQVTGTRGEKLIDILWEIAQGKPWTPTLPDGRTREPMVPTIAGRRAAALDLLAYAHGKPLLEFHARALRFIRDHGITTIHVSLADETDHAVAFVTFETAPPGA